MQNEDWVDILLQQIEEEIATVTKFKTHKARKSFLSRIRFLVKTAISKNATEEVFNRNTVKDTTTVLVPGKIGEKHKIMTQGESSYADDYQKNHYTKLK